MIELVRWHLLPVLLSLAMTATASPVAVAASQKVAPHLEVERAEAYPGDKITITGGGLSICQIDVEVFRLNSLILRSEPAGIEFGSEEGSDQAFSAEATVSPEAADGEYTIIASSCPNPSKDSCVGPTSVTACATLTVRVETDDQQNPDPADPTGNGDSPSAPQGGDAGQGAPVTVGSPRSGIDPEWLLPLVGLALLLSLLLLVGLAVQRLLLKRPPTIHIVPLLGVIVGPRVHPKPPDRDGVRIVPRADPGTRVLSTHDPTGRRSSL